MEDTSSCPRTHSPQENEHSLAPLETPAIIPHFNDHRNDSPLLSPGENNLDIIERNQRIMFEDQAANLSDVWIKTWHRKLYQHLLCGNWDGVQHLLSEEALSYKIVRRSSYSPLKKLHPLVLICRYGHINCLRPLLLIHSFTNRLEAVDLQEAMLEAARGAHWECFLLLREHRLHQDDATKATCFQIMDASKSGDLGQFQELLNMNLQEGLLAQGANVMNIVVMNGCPSSFLKAFIDLGMNANGFDNNFLTPLMSAVLSNNLECVRFLLEMGVDLNAAHSEGDEFFSGKTALMFAASLGNVECLNTFLSFCDKTDFNFLTSSKWTALTFACLYGNTECVLMLLNSGADIEICDDCENTIILPTMKSGSIECLRLVLSLVSREYCRYTLDKSTDLKCMVEHSESLSYFHHHYNFDLDTILNGGHTFLTLASSKGYIESVRWLLENGASINFIDRMGFSALMIACLSDQLDVLKLLIDYGANLDVQNDRGYNACMVCFFTSSTKCFQHLVTAGADLDQTNHQKRTVVTLAMSEFDTAGLKILFENGQILHDGHLKHIHMSAIAAVCQDGINELSATGLNFMISKGVFDWSWWSGCTFRTIAFLAVYHSVCPGAVIYHQMKMSPLVLAFVLNDVSTVKYFLANLYFYPEDYKMLCSSKTMRSLILSSAAEIQGVLTQLRDLLDSLFQQPLSLQTWSFLAASKAISCAGTPSQRPERVDSLPIPKRFKRVLKFRNKLRRVCGEFWKNVDIGYPGDLVFKQLEPAVSRETPLDCSCYLCKSLATTLSESVSDD